MREYGDKPMTYDVFEPEWFEYMHYLYLPVVMAGQEEVRLPPNLEFLRELIFGILQYENFSMVEDDERYVYVTARRGYATPGNPLNRPGWHTDGFGSDDVNFIWSDRWPTRFAIGDFGEISEDHIESAEQFENRIMAAAMNIGGTEKITQYEGGTQVVYRLTPSVVHSTPIIPAPGGDRSFFKISVSPNKYNLLGNSHNHLFKYDWEMWDRSVVRNDPAYAGGDFAPEEETS